MRRHGQEIVAVDSSSVAATGQGATHGNLDELGYRLPGMGEENQFELDGGAAQVSRTLFNQAPGHGKLAEDDFDFGSPLPSDALEQSAAEQGSSLATGTPHGASAAHSGVRALPSQPSDLNLDDGMMQEGDSSPGRGILHRNESDPSPTQGDREAPSFQGEGGGAGPQEAMPGSDGSAPSGGAVGGDG